MTMIQSIIGTSIYTNSGGGGWGAGVDPGSGISFSSIPGSPVSGLWRRKYNYYFADDIAGLLAASPASAGQDTDFAFSTNSEDDFSLMWTGYFSPPGNGRTKFRTTSDDSSYFWIGTDALTGSSISNVDINNGGLHGTTTIESTDVFALNYNLWYPIRAMFGESNGAETFNMEYNFEEQGWYPFPIVNCSYNASNAVDGF
jgi:hypothetical protein